MIYDADLLNLIRRMDGSEPCTIGAPDDWHPEGTNGELSRGEARAEALCGTCHLRDQCATYAMTHPVSGVWGATTEHDRERLHDNAQKDAA